MNLFLGLGIAVSWLALVYTSSAQLSSVIDTYTPACRLVVAYNASEIINTTVACSPLSIYAGYLDRVKLGFCTDSEYNNLTATVCGGNATVTDISSARANFYAAVNNVSTNCQLKTYNCIKSSVIPVVVRQQEKFCSLMSLNISGTTSELCLTTGDYNCSQAEFNTLKVAACSINTTNVDQNFSNALLSTTAKCQSMASECATGNKDAWYYVGTLKYCDSLNIKNVNGSAEDCFKQGGACTDAEFSALKLAACGPETATTTTTTIAKPSNRAINFSGTSVVYFLTLVLALVS